MCIHNTDLDIGKDPLLNFWHPLLLVPRHYNRYFFQSLFPCSAPRTVASRLLWRSATGVETHFWTEQKTEQI